MTAGQLPMASGVRSRSVRVRLCVAALVMTAVLLAQFGYRVLEPAAPPTVSARLEQFGPQVQRRLNRAFASVGLDYPPRQLLYLALKQERRLEVYARSAQAEAWRHIVDYPIREMSGTLGPKRAQGDGQVPEGVYRVQALNPDSRFHLALRLDYPNAADRAQAKSEGRTRLGGDIMIHGRGRSSGCLSLDDEAIEDLFVLAAQTQGTALEVWISPVDFRRYRRVPLPAGLLVEAERYREIDRRLQSLGKL